MTDIFSINNSKIKIKDILNLEEIYLLEENENIISIISSFPENNYYYNTLS